MAQGQDTGKAPENTADDAPAADDFGDAFAELTAPEPPKADAKPAAAAAGAGSEADAAKEASGAPAGPTGSAEALPDPAAVAAGAAKGAEAQPKEEPKPEPAAAGPTGAAAPDQGKQFLTELERIISGGQQPKQEEQQPPAVTPWTAEQEGAVKKAREEYPEVFEAVDLEMRRMAQTVVNHVFSNLRPTLSQLEGRVNETATMTHEQQLQAAVPDIAEIAPKVKAWVDTQPGFLKQAYDKVIESGSVAEVAEMVSQYRAVSGTAASAPKPANANSGQQGAPAQPTAAELEAKRLEAQRKKIAQGAAPVAAKRSASTGELLDADDFAGAFDSFAAAS